MPRGTKITSLQRQQVAHLLKTTKLSYVAVAKQTGMSKSTVQRLAKEFRNKGVLPPIGYKFCEACRCLVKTPCVACEARKHQTAVHAANNHKFVDRREQDPLDPNLTCEDYVRLLDVRKAFESSRQPNHARVRAL